MGFLKKLFGKERTHEEWLEANPGKSSKNAPPPEVDPIEEKATRDRMEAEMTAARTKREG